MRAAYPGGRSAGYAGRVRLPTPMVAVLLVALAPAARAGAPAEPADRLPTPRPEPCVAFTADPEEGEMAAPEGLDYEVVTAALGKVLPTALHCARPPGVARLRMTFELVVGCDGRVSTLECTRSDGAPEAYVACVSAVIRKADFPGHDLPDGMPITYPVNVAW